MDRNRRNRLIIVLLGGVIILILVLALAAGGGGGSGPSTTIGATGKSSDRGSTANTPEPVADIPPVIPSTTKVLSPETASRLASITADGNRYTFSTSTAELEQLKPGDVMVGDVNAQAPAGFMRKVVDVQRSGDQVQIQTTAAGLDEAIQDGTIHFRRALTPADLAHSFPTTGGMKLASPVRAGDGFVVQLKDVVLYDADNDLFTDYDQVKANGEVSFKPEIIFDISMKDSQLLELNSAVGYTVGQKVTITSAVEVKLFSPKIELRKLTMKPITVWVGSVPVVLVPVITLNVGLDGSISLGLETGVSVNNTVMIGMKYSHGALEPYSVYDWQADFEFPPAVVSEMSLKCYFYLRSNLLIYGVVGPFTGLKAGVEGEIKYYLNDPNSDPPGSIFAADPLPLQPAEWGKYYFASGTVGVRFDFLSHKLADKEATVLTLRVLMERGSTITPTPTPTIIITPGTTTPGPSMPSSAESSTVLLFDTSGSMIDPDSSGMTKLVAAQNAGKNILDMLRAENQALGVGGHRIGLAHFNLVAQVDADLSADLDPMNRALDALFPSGVTGMADGLDAALNMFPRSSKNGSKILILLSDGVPNLGRGGAHIYDQQTIENEILALAEDAGSQGICIYTVGFGEPGQVAFDGSPSLDEDILRQIAAKSGCGTYLNARNAIQLANVYVDLRHQSTGNVVLRAAGTVGQGETVDVGQFPVDANQEQLYMTLNWPGSKMEAVLTDPQGRVVNDQYSGATITYTRTLGTILIKNPQQGQWRLKGIGVEVPEGKMDFNAVVSTRQGSAPLPTSGSGLAVFLVLLALVGGGLGIYLISHRPKSVPAKQAYLLIQNSQGASESKVNITGEDFSIGRSPESDLVISDRSVSRAHAALRSNSEAWFIEDVGSAGGTYVNGVKIQMTRLHAGDRIKIGKTTMTFME